MSNGKSADEETAAVENLHKSVVGCGVIRFRDNSSALGAFIGVETMRF